MKCWIYCSCLQLTQRRKQRLPLLLRRLAWTAVMTVGLGPLCLQAGELAEPGDAPLFRASLKATFAAMAQRDQVASQLRDGSAVRLVPGQVLMVEETGWRLMTTPGRDSEADASAQPLDGPQIPTYDGILPNCGWPTTHDPTCQGLPTCSGPTCGCANCSLRAVIAGIQTPDRTNVQIHLQSQSDLLYMLQACTNLPSSNWVDIASAPGNGGLLVLTHTNADVAPRVFYRLQSQCQ